MAVASQGLTNRTNRRLARIRLKNPNALKGVRKHGYTVREARQIKRADQQQRSASRKAATPPKKKPAYNPLAPLTGAREKQETKAALRAQFGPKERELRSAMASEDQNAANQGTYYDDYQKMLAASTASIKADNAANVAATEGRADAAFQQDSAAVKARDAADSAAAAKLGRGPVQSQEGQQSVQAARSQGNQAAAEVRQRGASDSKYMELRSANSVLAKAQAMAREGAKKEKLREEGRQLASDKGVAAVNLRAKNRESERTWAATQKEFGLKELDINLKNKNTKADRGLERQKLNAQKTIAKLYSSSNKAKARATIRVAKLQLKKGEIDQHQYNTITNIYKGLPGGKGGKNGQPKLQTWEKDKVSNAVRILTKNNASVSEKSKWIKRMQDEGVPLRLARIAWGKYHPKGQTYTPKPVK